MAFVSLPVIAAYIMATSAAIQEGKYLKRKRRNLTSLNLYCKGL